MNNIKKDFIKWAKNELNMNVDKKVISVDEIHVNGVPELNVIVSDDEGEQFFELLENKKFSFVDAKPW